MSKSSIDRVWYFFLFLVGTVICVTFVYLLTSVEGCQSPLTTTGTIGVLGILAAAGGALLGGIGAVVCFWAAVSDPKERQ